MSLVRKLDKIGCVNLKGITEHKQEELVQLYVTWKQLNEVPSSQILISLNILVLILKQQQKILIQYLQMIL